MAQKGRGHWMWALEGASLSRGQHLAVWAVSGLSPAVWIWIVVGLASLSLWIGLIVQASTGRAAIPSRTAEPAGWPPWTAAIALFLGIFVIPGIQSIPQSPLHSVQLYCAAVVAFVVTAPLLMSRVYASRWSDFGLWRGGWGVDCLVGLAGFVAALLPVYAVAWPLLSYRQAHPHVMFQMLEGSAGWQGVFWVAVTVIVAAPLIEEFAFRVILQGTLATSMPTPAAVLLSSLIFAGVHYWADAIPLFPLALILGAIYARRRSYMAVVIVHGLFNGFSLLVALSGAG